jgi:hypothetical protein
MATSRWRSQLDHLAATDSATAGLRLYINGNLIDSTLMTGPLPDGHCPLRIGGNSIWSET